jgi:hypothetical protein
VICFAKWHPDLISKKWIFLLSKGRGKEVGTNRVLASGVGLASLVWCLLISGGVSRFPTPPSLRQNLHRGASYTPKRVFDYFLFLVKTDLLLALLR